MMKPTHGFVLALTTCMTAACAPIPGTSTEARASLRKDIDCGTARSDIEILQRERASNVDRLRSGVRSVLPIAAVAGAMKGEYREGVHVATGQYNDDIDHRIAAIKEACRVP